MRRQTVIAGIVYGIAAYFVMNYAVIPLSATGRGPFVLPVFINGILIHALGVGLPAAWFARESDRRDRIARCRSDDNSVTSRHNRCHDANRHSQLSLFVPSECFSWPRRKTKPPWN